MGDRAKANPKIEFCWSSQVIDIIGDDEVEKVKIKNLKDESETVIEAKGFFAALGHIPNTDIFDGIEKDQAAFYTTAAWFEPIRILQAFLPR